MAAVIWHYVGVGAAGLLVGFGFGMLVALLCTASPEFWDAPMDAPTASQERNDG